MSNLPTSRTLAAAALRVALRVAVALTLAAPGCDDAGGSFVTEPEPRPDTPPPTAAPMGHADLVRGRAPVAPFVAQQAREAPGAVVVYVGAAWCEPCRYFHAALERGELDTAFPGVRFVEYDLDADGAALEAAGYSSRMIPLFVVPEPDGRAGALRMEGSIRGPSAVRENLIPRLQQLGIGPPG